MPQLANKDSDGKQEIFRGFPSDKRVSNNIDFLACIDWLILVVGARRLHPGNSLVRRDRRTKFPSTFLHSFYLPPQLLHLSNLFIHITYSSKWARTASHLVGNLNLQASHHISAPGSTGHERRTIDEYLVAAPWMALNPQCCLRSRTQPRVFVPVLAITATSSPHLNGHRSKKLVLTTHLR